MFLVSKCWYFPLQISATTCFQGSEFKILKLAKNIAGKCLTGIGKMFCRTEISIPKSFLLMSQYVICFPFLNYVKIYLLLANLDGTNGLYMYF